MPDQPGVWVYGNDLRPYFVGFAETTTLNVCDGQSTPSSKGSAVGNEYETKDSGAKDTFATGYQRDCSTGKGAHNLLPFFALTRDAALYERGAAKYGPDNWTKGAPFSRTMQSAIRHLFQYMMGDRSEDHLAACRWGCAAIMTYEEMIKRGLLPAELDDLPKYTKSAPTSMQSTVAQTYYNR
jgi:hypothetical protein